MNIHPIKLSSISIPRTYRWKLTSEEHPDIHWWFKTIKTDYLNKLIYIKIYDDAHGKIFNWLQDLIKNPNKYNLNLSHVDAGMSPVSIINLIEITLRKHITYYDYSKGDVLTHKLCLSYKGIERKNLVLQNEISG